MLKKYAYQCFVSQVWSPSRCLYPQLHSSVPMTRTDHITLHSTAIADSQQKNPKVYLHDCQLIIYICIIILFVYNLFHNNYTSCNLSHPSVFLSSRTLLRTFITSCKTQLYIFKQKGNIFYWHNYLYVMFYVSLTSLKLREDMGLAISTLWSR